jgi:hypothetical protein
MEIFEVNDMAKTIKDKGPTGRLVNPKVIENALGAEETKVQIDVRRGPISLFPLRVIRSPFVAKTGKISQTSKNTTGKRQKSK